MFSDTNRQQTALQSAQSALTARITDGELAALARSAEVKVRAAAAAHPAVPLTTLLRLAEDEAVDVRIGVASNRRHGIPAGLFEDLAKDRNVDVVYALIANPAVPDALIARLGRQVHREYAKAARARLAKARRGEFLPEPEMQAAPQGPVVTPGATPRSTAPAASSRRVDEDALDALLGTRGPGR